VYQFFLLSDGQEAQEKMLFTREAVVEEGNPLFPDWKVAQSMPEERRNFAAVPAI